MKMTGKEWSHEIKVGAARSFGARHSKSILFLAALIRVGPVLLALGVISALTYLTVNTSAFAADVGVALFVLALIAALAAVAWHYLRWTLLQYIPVPGPVVAGLGLLILVAGGTLTMWAVAR